MKTTSSSRDDARWLAVTRRDQAADGQFIYAVKTTGVYCRPGCSARLARRENVVFFSSPNEAERAGFRACRRCGPQGPALKKKHTALVAAACRTIENAEVPPDLETLARSAGMSRFHFHRVFKTVAGLTPKAFAAAGRSRKVREELTRQETVTEAIYAAGYQSNSRFYAEAARALGMKPKKYLRGGAGATIHFAVGRCSLGSILVAASEKGICAVLLGGKPAALREDLRRRFPRAELAAGDGSFEKLVAKVIALVEAPALGLDLPLDLRGSAFAQRVWLALRKIPAGSTASYAEIAASIGQPKAARAVARACAANPVAVIVPCHRVVRSDGSLSGYRWGTRRKRVLLDRETRQI